MSEKLDTPPLDDEKKERRHSIRRKTVTRISPVAEEKDIENCLTNIYQDENGEMPNMKRMAIKKSGSFGRFVSVVFMVGIVAAVLAWAGFFFLPSTNITSDQIDISIDGPNSVSIGATTTYQITYSNQQENDLNNVTLNLYYPEGFVYTGSSLQPQNAGHNEWKIGTVDHGTEKTLTITGKYFGAVNDQKSWRAFFNYTPSNFNSELQKITTKVVTITDSPYHVSMTGPDQIAVGADAIYVFHAITDKTSGQPLLLSPVLPTNFQLASSSPALDKNYRWNVNFTSSTDVMFSLKGKFKDSTVTTNGIKAILYLPLAAQNQLFQVASTEIKPTITKNDVTFATAINGKLVDFTTKPDEKLNITINFKNTSQTEIKNASLVLSLEGPSVKHQSALSWSEIKDSHNGDIVGEQLNDTIRRGQITWTSKKIPALGSIKPNDTVTIDLSIPVKDTRDFDFSSAKENTIKVNTSLSYVDSGQTKTLAASPLTLIIASDLAFKGKDTVSTNSQGKEEHLISWTLTNNLHDLKNITVTANAYGDTTYLVGAASSGTADYNPSTKKLTWTIPSMPESVDVATNNFTLVLGTKNPTQNTLLSKVSVQATDVVTNQTITLEGSEIGLK